MHHVNNAKPLIHLTRGNLVESIHHGYMAVVDLKGNLKNSIGNPHYMTYARSSAKLLQALAVVASGAIERFGLQAQHIAMMCASHQGETFHTEAVEQILQSIGFDLHHLQCGSHFPTHQPSADALQKAGLTPNALHNNCSGKHAGMLTLSRFLNYEVDDYLTIKHPVQQAMLEVFSLFTNVPKNEIDLGIDGCGVPVYGIPLSRFAHAYAHLGTPTEPQIAHYAQACKIITDSLTLYPEMIAGTERYDSELIRVTQGRVIGKEGAEGIYAATLIGQGIGLALKVEDGNHRAVCPSVTEALLQLGWISKEEGEALASFCNWTIKNWSGTEVGKTLPVFRFS